MQFTWLTQLHLSSLLTFKQTTHLKSAQAYHFSCFHDVEMSRVSTTKKFLFFTISFFLRSSDFEFSPRLPYTAEPLASPSSFIIYTTLSVTYLL